MQPSGHTYAAISIACTVVSFFWVDPNWTIEAWGAHVTKIIPMMCCAGWIAGLLTYCVSDRRTDFEAGSRIMLTVVIPPFIIAVVLPQASFFCAFLVPGGYILPSALFMLGAIVLFHAGASRIEKEENSNLPKK